MADERLVPGGCNDIDQKSTDQTVPVTIDQLDGKPNPIIAILYLNSYTEVQYEKIYCINLKKFLLL